jgi:lactaldehyde dehydrogenase/glycolaldehyde dehydrogenase
MSIAVSDPTMYIGGEWIGSGDTRDVINPADESVAGAAVEATVEHVDQALQAAKRAQPEWARLSGIERGAALRAIAAGIRANAEELARIVVAEQGKTVREARAEIGGTAGFFEYYATYERGRAGEIFHSDNRREQIQVRTTPYGVVAGIVPWNFPAAIFARKVAPAIMAGNAIVLKPHEDTPLSALALGRVVEEAGVPPGIVNVVTGAGKVVGDALVRHPLTSLVTVTGSVRAGREILAAASHNITAVSLELGGKAPFIVLDDADLERAVQDAVSARFWNCGQVCTCNERTYVHRSRYDEFVERFVAAARELRVGDPTSEDSDMGPKVSEAELVKVQEMVDAAVAGGAEVVLGGGPPEGDAYAKGYWFAPTVLTSVSEEMDVLRSEVFGPVLPIQPIDSFEEAVALANDSPYGLTAYIYTKDYDRAMRAAEEIEFGEVYVNKIGPEQVQGFHTGYRNSGMGGDDGPYGYERYLRRKTVYLSHD